jgi:hypothetical protein
MLLTQVQLHTIAHQNRVSSFLKELHESPSDRKSYESKKNSHKDWRLKLTTIGLNAGNENITNYSTHSND